MILRFWLVCTFLLLSCFALAEAQTDTKCQTQITEGLTSYISEMRFESWQAINEERSLNMFGCPFGISNSKPEDCLTNFPLAREAEWAKSWAASTEQNIRILKQMEDSTILWLRSSADGRFIGTGVGGITTERTTDKRVIIDLTNERSVAVPGSSHLVFHPGGEGFSGRDDIFWTCRSTVLKVNEPIQSIDYLKHRRCGNRNAPRLHDPVARINATPDGSDFIDLPEDYRAHTGQDTTGSGLELSVKGFASPDAMLEFHPAFNTGSGGIKFQNLKKKRMPFEGHWSVSPSRGLLVARIASQDGETQVGYRIKLVTPITAPSLDFTVSNVGTICLSGNKAVLSYGERMMAVHHYTAPSDWRDLGFASPDDKRFEKLVDNSSNIWVADLKTGKTYRLTNMQAGQFALYPQFRSDGWLYFLVREKNRGTNHLVATDAVIRLENM